MLSKMACDSPPIVPPITIASLLRSLIRKNFNTSDPTKRAPRIAIPLTIKPTKSDPANEWKKRWTGHSRATRKYNVSKSIKTCVVTNVASENLAGLMDLNNNPGPKWNGVKGKSHLLDGEGKRYVNS
jgi:hypothetical protein